MKKMLCLMMACLMIASLCGCAASKEINDKVYKPVGIFNQDEKSTNVHYSVSVGNVVWSILLCETVVVPIVLVGWYIENPDCSMQEFKSK